MEINNQVRVKGDQAEVWYRGKWLATVPADGAQFWSWVLLDAARRLARAEDYKNKPDFGIAGKAGLVGDV